MSGTHMVYILASRKNGTLYVGATSDPVARIWTQRNRVAGAEEMGKLSEDAVSTATTVC